MSLISMMVLFGSIIFEVFKVVFAIISSIIVFVEAFRWITKAFLKFFPNSRIALWIRFVSTRDKDTEQNLAISLLVKSLKESPIKRIVSKLFPKRTLRVENLRAGIDNEQIYYMNRYFYKVMLVVILSRSGRVSRRFKKFFVNMISDRLYKDSVPQRKNQRRLISKLKKVGFKTEKVSDGIRLVGFKIPRGLIIGGKYQAEIFELMLDSMATFVSGNPRMTAHWESSYRDRLIYSHKINYWIEGGYLKRRITHNCTDVKGGIVPDDEWVRNSVAFIPSLEDKIAVLLENNSGSKQRDRVHHGKISESDLIKNRYISEEHVKDCCGYHDYGM